MTKRNILITGGCGYIGSHLALNLIENGYNVHIIDDNSSRYSNDNMNILTDFNKSINIIKLCIGDFSVIDNIFKMVHIDLVIHLADYNNITDSIKDPLKYYSNNVKNMIILLEIMKTNNCYKLIYASSSDVYGFNKKNPLTESSLYNPINPYAQSKCMAEQMLLDICKSSNLWNVVILRYFNPIGCVAPLKLPTYGIIHNILNCSNENKFVIYGDKYNTIDGTCIRDYIHIRDLLKIHDLIIDKILNNTTVADNNINIYNIGSGKGYSVKNIIKIFNEYNYKINYEVNNDIVEPVPIIYANIKKINDEFKWKPKIIIGEAIQSIINSSLSITDVKTK